MVFHLFDGFVGNRKSKLLLRDGKVEPEFSPSVVSVLSREIVGSIFRPPSGVGRLTAAEKRYAISLLAYRLRFPVQSILTQQRGKKGRTWRAESGKSPNPPFWMGGSRDR